MRYLIDSSVWVEYFRGTGSGAHLGLARLVSESASDIWLCPPVRFELSLDQDDLRRRRLLRVLDAFPTTSVKESDFELAGDLYRAVRATGHSPRGLIDCLIGAIAVRTDSVLVHRDIDVDRIAEVMPELSVLRLPGA